MPKYSIDDLGRELARATDALEREGSRFADLDERLRDMHARLDRGDLSGGGGPRDPRQTDAYRQQERLFMAACEKVDPSEIRDKDVPTDRIKTYEAGFCQYITGGPGSLSGGGRGAETGGSGTDCR